MARQLTDKQKRFAENKYILGMSGGMAARRAGYKEKSAYLTAYRNIRNDNIREYVIGKAREEGLPDQVLSTIREALQQKPTKPATWQDRLSAARQGADILGLQAPKRQEKVSIDLTQKTTAELLQELEALRQEITLLEEGPKSVDI